MSLQLNSVVSTINETVTAYNVALIESYDFNSKCGIDTLYYYLSSNDVYLTVFNQLMADIEEKREELGGFIPKDTCLFCIGDTEYFYNGKSKGFHYFVDKARWFRFGLKDSNTIKNVLDIHVQLESNGIYTVGITRLLSYVNNTVFGFISNGVPQLSRLDINIFAQFDLSSVICKEYFHTRKRHYTKETGKRNGYETLKIGKPPFLLRMYDKLLELKKKDKRSIMEAYFLSHGFDLEQPLWNMEFECHREFLKEFGIFSIEDALANVNALFHQCMELIRYVDISSLSPSAIKNQRFKDAPTHVLWKYLDDSYDYDAYKQSSENPSRILSARKKYDVDDFKEDINKVITKAEKHKILIERQDIIDILHESKLSMLPSAKKILNPKPPIKLVVQDTNYILTSNKTVVRTLPKDLSLLTDKQIEIYEQELIPALHKEYGALHSDINLIALNISLLSKEKLSRKRKQKELDLWQA